MENQPGKVGQQVVIAWLPRDRLAAYSRPMMSRAVTLGLVIMVVFVAAPGGRSARAEGETSNSFVRQEWGGIEISPLSFNMGSAPDGQHPTRVQFGPGGILRVLRHRWEWAYVTPVQAGLFLGYMGDRTILVHVDAEGGIVLRLPDGAQSLELGLACGVGILAMSYANVCDGSCNIGGAGPLLSPVARYLIRSAPRFPLGFTLRAMIPLHVPDGDYWGYHTARGILFLAAFDLAFGS